MQLALTVGGAYLGSLVPGLPPNLGQAIGASIGSMAGAYFFGPELPDIQGPRLEDLKVQTSTNGMSIPIVYGAYRLVGNIIYSTDIVETITEEEVGGKGGPSATKTTYSYSVSLAVGICEGPIDGIRRIWANGKLIYNADTGLRDSDIGDMRIYLGTEDQEPDSYWQGIYGIDNTPAHRGLVYVTFENLQLATFGSRIPNLSFEVYPSGTAYWLSSIVYNNSLGELDMLAMDANSSYVFTSGLFYPYDYAMGGFYISRQGLDGQIDFVKQIEDPDYGYGYVCFVKGNHVYISTDNHLLFKITLDGEIVWQKKFDYNYLSVGYLEVDEDDNVYYYNTYNKFWGPIGLRDWSVLIKLDSSGTIVWQKNYNISSDRYVRSANGNFVTSKFTSISSSGSVLWSKGYTEPGYVSMMKDVACDSQNNCYFLMYWYTNTYVYYSYLIKLDVDGNLIYVKNMVGEQAPLSVAFAKIKIDSDDNLYLLGTGPSYGQIIITKLDSDANIVWSKQIQNLNSLFEAFGNSHAVTNNWIAIGGYYSFIYGNTMLFRKDGPNNGTYSTPYFDVTIDDYGITAETASLTMSNQSRSTNDGALETTNTEFLLIDMNLENIEQTLIKIT